MTNIRVYPNPASGVIHFPLAGNITLYSLGGTELLHAENMDMLDLSGLEDGAYFLRIDGSSTRIIKR